MKGYIPIEIPTKKYIKAYLLAQLGNMPVMSSSNRFGNKFYDLLRHTTNERKNEFSNVRYNARIKLFVNYHTFKQRGACLNETNIKSFNVFVEDEVKSKFHFLMDMYNEHLASFEAHLPEVRKKLGIDIEAWSDDSMKKEYYRYRLDTKKPLFYKNIYTRTVPSERADNTAF